jgi:hypothetical protein
MRLFLSSVSRPDLEPRAAYHHREHFSRPKLEIDYQDAANKVEIISEKIDGIDPGAVFIRARVRNTGRRTAKGARVFLASLQEVHHAGTATQTSFNDASLWLGRAGISNREIYLPPQMCTSMWT